MLFDHEQICNGEGYSLRLGFASKQEGLTSFFHQNGDFQELVHMVYALAFVPVDQITEYYEAVILVRI